MLAVPTGVFKPDEVGLEDSPRKDWPAVGAGAEAPIDRLKPGSVLHERVKEYLLKRLVSSEREMSKFYARWGMLEKKMQAFIDLPDWEQRLKEMNESGKPPSAVSIVIPSVFATINTIVTYLIHTFTGKRPLFEVGSYDAAAADNARMQEIKMQYDSDHTRMVRALIQFFYDGQVYGVGVLGVQWRNETGMRTVRRFTPQYDLYGNEVGVVDVSGREERTIYEGNAVHNIDPFMFFPDPRVPMEEVNSRGEFVFWRKFEGRHMLLREEAAGRMKWVRATSQVIPRMEFSQQSNRGVRGGASNAGYDYLQAAGTTSFMQVDQGCIELIPRELGLSDVETPEKWLFTILNKNQIVQAMPFEADHGKFPVVVSEPYSQGYGFGNPSIADYIAPFQDIEGWFVNSHIDNVRKVLNDMLIVDPSMVEMQDLKNPEPGKLIRLKRAAFGQDVRAAISQLQVQDVTAGHMQDYERLGKTKQQLSAVNENVMGIQDSGGRKTATEVRTAGDAAVSRLAAQARIISAKGMVDLTEMMSMNNMQYLSAPFYVSVVGKDGMTKGLWIRPEMLVGDFYYPVHDGTLPSDKVAMLDVWKEVLLAVLQDPGLRGAYDVTKLFEYVATLGGAKNIQNMRVKGMDPGRIDAGVGSGNLAPMGGGKPPMGIDANASDRAASGIFG